MPWKRKKKPQDKELAVGNDLLRMKMDLNNNEVDVFMFVVSLIDPKSDPSQPIVVKFDMKDLYSIFASRGIPFNRSRLVAAARDLNKKGAGIEIRTGKRIDIYNVFSHVCIDEGRAIFEFNSYFKNDLLDLKSKFTRLSYSNIASLRSFHAKGLYMNIRTWAIDQGSNVRYYGTAYLMHLLGLSDGDYVYYGYFNRKLFEKQCLFPAIEEINETDVNPKGNTDLVLTCRRVRAKSKKTGNLETGYDISWKFRDNGTKSVPPSAKAIKDSRQMSIVPGDPNYCGNPVDEDDGDGEIVNADTGLTDEEEKRKTAAAKM